MPNLDDINLNIKTVAEDAGIIALGLELQKLAQDVIDFGAATASSMVQAAASAENVKVAFDSAFGNNSGSILQALDKMQYSMPLTKIQLDNMALALKTAGMSMPDIIQNLKDIADVASGTGTSIQEISNHAQDLGNVLAKVTQYGQVSSLFIRPLISDNIPIIDALVKAINNHGGAADETTKQITKSNTQLDTAKAKQADLTAQIADATEKLKILEETHIKVGFAVSNSAKTQDAHNLSVVQAQQRIEALNEELKKTNDIIANIPTQETGKHLVTSQDFLRINQSMVITAQVFQEALHNMAQTQFLNDAMKQVQTFSGSLQNFGKLWMDLAQEIMGVNEDNTIQKGGVFDHLRQAASTLFKLITDHKQDIANWAKGVVDQINPIIDMFIKQIPTIISYFKDHQKDLSDFFTKGIKDFIDAIKYLIDHKDTILSFITNLGSLLNDLVPSIQAMNTLFTNLNFLGTKQGQQMIAGNLATSPILPFLPGGSAIQNTAQAINRSTNITMHNNVSQQANWQSILAQIGWLINGR